MSEGARIVSESITRATNFTASNRHGGLFDFARLAQGRRGDAMSNDKPVFRNEFLIRLRNRPEPGRPNVELPERSCPRCLQPFTTANGSYLTGHSRKDRSIEICSACVAHEGWQVLMGVDLATQVWPVDVPSSFRY